MSIFKQHKILIMALIAGVILLVLYGMSNKSKTPQSTLVRTNNSSVNIKSESEILSLLHDVQSITLDGSIFKNPAFSSLRDFSRKIILEPAGKDNPFNPNNVGAKENKSGVSNDSSASATQTTSGNNAQTPAPILPDAL